MEGFGLSTLVMLMLFTWNIQDSNQKAWMSIKSQNIHGAGKEKSTVVWLHCVYRT